MNSAACALLLPSLPDAVADGTPLAAAVTAGDRESLSRPSCAEACGLGLMGVDMGLGCGVALLVR